MVFTLKRFFKNHKKHQLIPVVVGAIVVLGLIAVGGSYAGFLKTQLVLPTKNGPITNGPFPRPSTPTTPTTPSSTPPVNVGVVDVVCIKNPVTRFDLDFVANCQTGTAKYKVQQNIPFLSCGAGGKVIANEQVVVSPTDFSCRIIEKKNGLTTNIAGKGTVAVKCIESPLYDPVVRHTCKPGLEPVYKAADGKGYRFTTSCIADASKIKRLPAVLQKGSTGSPEKIVNQLVCGTPTGT